MSARFRRRLVDYADYHRDPGNCAMHVVGIILLFLGAILPFSAAPVSVFGLRVDLGAILVLPVLAYWLALDPVLGLAIAAAAAALLAIAAAIAGHAGATTVWIASATLIVLGVAAQIVGHRYFERRKPALADNPSHFLLGPMFVMAKLFIALGFRRDLAEAIQGTS
jgi:uncharacterized membrane protein YGL010W